MRHDQGTGPGTSRSPAREPTQALTLNRTHRILIAIVVLGAAVIAAIGFAGSYAAVRELAGEKGFGDFAAWFPIGIDAGIVVLLALDLLLTWIRIPFPLLRQTAWLLTAATIAFNGAAAWPDPLGVAMHGAIPVLFVVSVEAARHAIGRIADITADKYMEGVRVSRWLLAFPSTFRLWRRMKLWELRSYEEVIRLEQDRMVYRARLRARYGRAWRRRAPVEAVMPLKLARYGVPLAETAPGGLAAAGIEPPELVQSRELPMAGEPEAAEIEREPVREPVTDWQQEAVHVPYVEPVPPPAPAAEQYGREYPAPYEQPRPEADLQPVVEPSAEVVVEPTAAPARRPAPKRVEAKLDDAAPSPRSGRGGSTRDQVAEIYRNLPEETRALRGRRLAAAIVAASGDTLKLDTVRRSHISEGLLAEYLQSAPVPAPREDADPEDVG